MEVSVVFIMPARAPARKRIFMYLKNYWTESYEIWWDDWFSAKEKMSCFWDPARACACANKVALAKVCALPSASSSIIMQYIEKL